MSLPGGWRAEDRQNPILSSSSKGTQNQRIKPSKPSYSTLAVTQFCNEHLKELNDLQNLHDLIASLNEQKIIIATQMNDSEARLNDLRRYIMDKSRVSLSATSTFQSHYHDLTFQINNSWTTNYAHHEGLTQLEALDTKRRDLLRARSYIQILLQVLDISEQIHDGIKTNSQEALRKYSKLSELSNQIQSRNEKAWESMPHLSDYIDSCVKQLWNEMEDTLSVDMRSTLKLLGWPNQIKSPLTSNEGLQQLKLAFQKMPILQLPLDAASRSLLSNNVLLPFKVMARDVDIRFRYHFENDRPTNNIEKPEWFFQNVLKTLATHRQFICTEIQTILDDLGIQRNALTEFITALLPIVQRKIDNISSELLKDGSLLSHFVYESLSFDKAIDDTYHYVPTGRGKWDGITQYFLCSPRNFRTWRDVEKNFAESRYNEILSASDASEIEYEAISALEVKPTKGAMRIIDLIESFTDRFRGLAAFEQRLELIINVQIAILDLYHNKWKGNIEKFEISHPYALAGELREESKKTAGIAGLQRLCRIYGSSTWIEDHLKDSTDEVFLDVYAEIIDRVENGRKISESYTAADLANTLSMSIRHSDNNGTVFDITINKFHTLKTRSIKLIESHLKKEIFEALRPYTNLLHWSSLNSKDGEEFSYSSITNSRELLKALPLLTSSLEFLHRTLQPQIFNSVFKYFALDLEGYIWEWIVTAHRFTASGGILFGRDMYLLWDTCSKFVPRAETYMKRLHDAVILLSLPSSVSAGPSEGELTLATITKRLRDLDDMDLVKTAELQTWLAENMEVKTLSVAEVLYMYFSLELTLTLSVRRRLEYI